MLDASWRVFKTTTREMTKYIAVKHSQTIYIMLHNNYTSVVRIDFRTMGRGGVNSKNVIHV